MTAPHIVRRRTYDWEDQEATRSAVASMDGLSILLAIGAGKLPVPPALRTLGIEPIEAAPGHVSFRLEPAEFHLNPLGLVHGGVMAALLDTAMGCAVHSLLPAATGYVTGELNVRFLRPGLITTGSIVCTGDVVHAGTRSMVAEARVVDERDRVIAVAGSTCLVQGSR